MLRRASLQYVQIVLQVKERRLFFRAHGECRPGAFARENAHLDLLCSVRADWLAIVVGRCRCGSVAYKKNRRINER